MLTLQEINVRQWRRRERSREACRETLRALFHRELEPGTRVWLFGSVTRPGKFHEASDIDVALEGVDSDVVRWVLQREVSAATGRECDVIRMEDSPRMAPRIRREGEAWTV